MKIGTNTVCNRKITIRFIVFLTAPFNSYIAESYFILVFSTILKSGTFSVSVFMPVYFSIMPGSAGGCSLTMNFGFSVLISSRVFVALDTEF